MPAQVSNIGVYGNVVFPMEYDNFNSCNVRIRGTVVILNHLPGPTRELNRTGLLTGGLKFP